MRTILLYSIGISFLPKATGNQFSQHTTKMSWEAEEIQFFLFCAIQYTFQWVLSTSQIIEEVTEILFKQSCNKTWEYYKSPDFSAHISQSTLFWIMFLIHSLLIPSYSLTEVITGIKNKHQTSFHMESLPEQPLSKGDESGRPKQFWFCLTKNERQSLWRRKGLYALLTLSATSFKPSWLGWIA